MTSFSFGMGRKCCINCSADLDLSDSNKDMKDRSAFYTLNCSSRVRSPLSPATVELIPVHHALATIFNFDTLEKVSSVGQSTNNNNTMTCDDRERTLTSRNQKQSQENDVTSQNPLKDFQTAASTVPICFVCYLVLSDLYRIYTEFSQLRKANSFLGSKLQELENCLKAQQNRSQNVGQNHNQSQIHSQNRNLTRKTPSNLNHNLRTTGTSNTLIPDVPLTLHSQSQLEATLGLSNTHSIPFQIQIQSGKEQGNIEISGNPDPGNLNLLEDNNEDEGHYDGDLPLSSVDVVKLEVYEEGEMDTEELGGVTEDEEGGGDFEDMSRFPGDGDGDVEVDPLATHNLTSILLPRENQNQNHATPSRKPRTNPEKAKYVCPSQGCRSRFTLKCSLQRHFREQHTEATKEFTCPFCSKDFTRTSWGKKHMTRCKARPGSDGVKVKHATFVSNSSDSFNNYSSSSSVSDQTREFRTSHTKDFNQRLQSSGAETDLETGPGPGPSLDLDLDLDLCNQVIS